MKCHFQPIWPCCVLVPFHGYRQQAAKSNHIYIQQMCVYVRAYATHVKQFTDAFMPPNCLPFHCTRYNIRGENSIIKFILNISQKISIWKQILTCAWKYPNIQIQMYMYTWCQQNAFVKHFMYIYTTSTCITCTLYIVHI